MEGIMCNIRRIIIGQLLIIYLSVPLALADSSRFIDNGNRTVIDGTLTLGGSGDVTISGITVR
jgi:hypothetical protein